MKSILSNLGGLSLATYFFIIIWHNKSTAFLLLSTLGKDALFTRQQVSEVHWEVLKYSLCFCTVF